MSGMEARDCEYARPQGLDIHGCPDCGSTSWEERYLIWRMGAPTDIVCTNEDFHQQPKGCDE